MSTVVPPPQGHRHTKNGKLPAQNQPSNSQAHSINSHTTMNYSAQPSTPPRTPRKVVQPSSQPRTNSTAHETGSKQKPRNKKPKNVMTSPAVTRHDRNTSPLTGTQSAGMQSSAKSISTPSTAAYAGPTFHASPAPSALPIPSFYSKSVPESPGMHAMRVSSEMRTTESPTPAANSLAQQRQESPLDFMFKAHREEEQLRARSASSTQAAISTTGPFQPPAMSPQPRETPPAPVSHSRPYQHNRVSSSGMFAMELDGESTPGTPYGPAFSTPYLERISAAKSGASLEPASKNTQQTSNSEALKAYLFSEYQPPSTSTSSPGTYNPTTTRPFARDVQRSTPVSMEGPPDSGSSSRPQNHHVGSQEVRTKTQTPKILARSSGLRQEVTPTRTPTKTPERVAEYPNSPTPSRTYRKTIPTPKTHLASNPGTHSTSSIPAPSPSDRNPDIRGMEDSLRKLLKLDSTSSSVQSGISSVPTPPLPGYISGRSQ